MTTFTLNIAIITLGVYPNLDIHTMPDFKDRTACERAAKPYKSLEKLKLLEGHVSVWFECVEVTK